MRDIIVWVADVGSIMRNGFGWCRSSVEDNTVKISTGTDISLFAEGISKDLRNRKRVALGFECPLFLPITDNPMNLTSARQGEGNRAWSAGAGCGSLAVGLTESVWIFERIREKVGIKNINTTFDWDKFFSDNEVNLFIWEAFVTGEAKSKTHSGDAVIAAQTFWHKFPNIIESNAVTVDSAYSLVGAALLRSMLSTNLKVLFESCIVLKS